MIISKSTSDTYHRQANQSINSANVSVRFTRTLVLGPTVLVVQTKRMDEYHDRKVSSLVSNEACQEQWSVQGTAPREEEALAVCQQ